MDQATYDEIFYEPRWHAWVDVVAVLVISLLIAATALYAVAFYESLQPQITPSQSQTLPNGIKIEEA